VAWYRFAATLARRRGGFVALIVLIGLVGGLAMGSIAAARRTQSSFPRYLASTNPSDLNGITSFVNPTPGPGGLGYNPSVLTRIAGLPHVQQATTDYGLNVIPLGHHGVPENPAAYPASAGEVLGIGNAVGRTLDQPTVTQGRMFDPRSADEFVVTATTAKIFGFHVGQVVPFGVYTNTQTNSPDFGTAAVVPSRRFRATLVGIVVMGSSVVQDDTDGGNNANLLAFPPGLTRTLRTCCVYYTATAVKVAGGPSEVTTVQREISSVLPPGLSPFVANGASAIEIKAERAIKPESIALGVFGAICALAALLIAGQIIGRQLRLGAVDLSTLRSLGADPRMTLGDGLIGIFGAVVIGSLLAGGVAVALSPLSPLGPVRPVDPAPGVAFDWTVLIVGVLALVLVLSAVGLVVGLRLAPQRFGSHRQQPAPQRSAVAGYAAASGLPEAAVTGIRFALEPGVGRNAVPVRSAILGSVLAVVVVISTVTFGASLKTLISHPALYGWNWSYELSSNQGGVIPGDQAAGLLRRDRYVAAWSGVSFGTMRIGGQLGVPTLGEAPGARVSPPLLSGHEVEAKDQIVVGAVTLDQLHRRIGDTVTARVGGTTAPAPLRIVGTATMPTIGGGEGGQHLEMGTGAVVSSQIFPSTAATGYQLPGAAPGPNAILVRLKEGSPDAGRRSLQRIATTTSTPADYGVSLLAVQRPAEIVNYRSMGGTPAILGGALAAGVAAALGLTLVASVRRRQRDLALFKTLGFTRGQMAAAVSWQSSISVAIGVALGIPAGIIVGRSLWILFADQINVVPTPTIPPTTIALIAAAALVLANLVAAIPARIAARTPTALLLRAE
jgi:hypothetical protein